MAGVMIGIDPHKGSHTAVAVDPRSRSSARCGCAPRPNRSASCRSWADRWRQRTWAVEGSSGLGHLLVQQLVASGERVLDVQPKLAARVRLRRRGRARPRRRADPATARRSTGYRLGRGQRRIRPP
jgi:hypothetical protein